MKKLPKRHRSHQLETESVRAFENLLPSVWVYRTPTNDYGIDGEIEIFAADGSATGEKFLVQLKATDVLNTKKALKIRLPVEKANYYDALNVPVLLVRYLSSEKKIFTRWFHSFDAYSEKYTDKELQFNFNIHDEWYEGRVESILEDLNAFNLINKSKDPFPIKIKVIISSNCILGNSFSEFISRLSCQQNIYERIFLLQYTRETNNNGPNYIRLDNEKIGIVLANKNKFSIKFKGGFNGSYLDNISNDIFVGLGLVIFSRGFYVQAGQILYDLLNKSTFRNDFKICAAAITSLIKSNSIDKALEITRILFSREEGFASAQLSLAIIIKNFQNEDTANVDRLLQTLDQVRLSLLENGIDNIAGIVAYNHANFLRSKVNNPSKALSLYKIASRYYSDYKNRSYWLAEVGGCLFLLGRFNLSSKFYKASLDLKFSNDIQPLYADALFFSGQYKDSLDEFHIVLKNKDINKIDAEWNLKCLCLEALVNTFGILKQKRTNDIYKFNSIDKNNECELFEYIINNDALNSEAWFNIGEIKLKNKDYDNSFISFLISSFSGLHNFSSWYNTFSVSFQLNDNHLQLLVIICAHKILGDYFIHEFFSEQNLLPGHNPIDAQLSIIDLFQQLKDINKDGRSMLLRMHKFDGGYDEFVSNDI